jgi:hypothetical protein
MDLATDFSFQPLPAVENEVQAPFPEVASPLGPLAGLVGKWSGKGFNLIWRPDNGAQDHFLELNVTSEQLEFSPISGSIPNRGLLQPDIAMFGLTYLQQISENPTVARLASIPHGTAIVAQGTASTAAGAPTIPGISIKPFTIGQPLSLFDFAEETLSAASSFRTAGTGLTGVTQEMVSNPNSVLQAAIAGEHISETTTLHVNTNDAPILGGGTANTAFLKGGGGGPNAVSASVNATFWLETIEGNPVVHQLQYTQTVLLNFNTLSWPHITVGTLRPVA